MKQTTFLLLLGSMVFIFPSRFVTAAEFPPKPSREHYFSDNAGMLKPEDAQGIDQVASQLLREQQIPIIVATIPSLVTYQAMDMTVDGYAKALFNRWGIGSPERNYGILLLVSRGDRKARIELGSAWTADQEKNAQYIMDRILVPSFKTENYSGGIRLGVEALDKMARGLGLPLPVVPWWIPVALVVGLGLLIGVIISLFRSGRSGWGWVLLAGLFGLLFFLLRASSKSRGSGGSFRGGSSNGRGASGSW